MIDLNYGRIVKNGLVEYAPAGLTQEQLGDGGYKRVVKNAKPEPPENESKVWQFAGYEESDGVIRKTYRLRDKYVKPAKYSKDLIFQNIQEKYGVQTEYLQNLVENKKDIYEGLAANDVYIQDCSLLQGAITAFMEQFHISEDEALAQIINPSRIDE